MHVQDSDAVNEFVRIALRLRSATPDETKALNEISKDFRDARLKDAINAAYQKLAERAAEATIALEA